MFYANVYLKYIDRNVHLYVVKHVFLHCHLNQFNKAIKMIE
jgi:hypothetical protein